MWYVNPIEFDTPGLCFFVLKGVRKHILVSGSWKIKWYLQATCLLSPNDYTFPTEKEEKKWKQEGHSSSEQPSCHWLKITWFLHIENENSNTNSVQL